MRTRSALLTVVIVLVVAFAGPVSRAQAPAARQTPVPVDTSAELLAEEFQLPDTAVCFAEALYNADPATLEQELRRHAAPTGLTVLVAHNPGISNLARSLAHDAGETMLRPAEWRLLSLR